MSQRRAWTRGRRIVQQRGDEKQDQGIGSEQSQARAKVPAEAEVLLPGDVLEKLVVIGRVQDAIDLVAM